MSDLAEVSDFLLRGCWVVVHLLHLFRHWKEHWRGVKKHNVVTENLNDLDFVDFFDAFYQFDLEVWEGGEEDWGRILDW